MQYLKHIVKTINTEALIKNKKRKTKFLKLFYLKKNLNFGSLKHFNNRYQQNCVNKIKYDFYFCVDNFFYFVS